jgi:hypothetical protein
LGQTDKNNLRLNGLEAKEEAAPFGTASLF